MSLIRKTESLCPVCLRVLPAKMIERGDEVFLERTCPEHGLFSAVVWRGEPRLAEWSRFKNPGGADHVETQRNKGCPYDCGLCNEHRQHSCTVLFEITQACNLRCPVCFASSGEPAPGPDTNADAATAKAGFTPLPLLIEQLNWIHSRAPEVVLQISGGEPTLHPELPALARQAAQLFPAVQLNTNGLRLAESPELCLSLKEAGLSWVFLQFDGTTDYIYRAIRGQPLLELKRQAIANCRKAGLGVVLVPTLARGINDGNLGAILDFAIAHAPAVRGIHIQPMAVMGRNLSNDVAKERLTLPEVLNQLSLQSGGRISPAHATPPGCEHERCSFHCRYILGPNKELKPVRETVCCSSSAIRTPGEASCCVQPQQRKVPILSELHLGNIDMPDKKPDKGAGKAISTLIRSWGAPAPQTDESGADDSLSRFIRQARQHTFSVTCMAFQDAMTVDLDRLQGCCVHVFAPPSRLVPFCSYNLTALDGHGLHRGRQR